MDSETYESLQRAPGMSESERGTSAFDEGTPRRWSETAGEIGQTGRIEEIELGGTRGTRRANLQERVTDLLSVRSFADLERQVRENPFGTIALAAGIGFALQRTHVLDGVVSGMMLSDAPSDLTPIEERLLAWLNDAYALENAQIPILENHAEDARRQPHVRRKDLEHLEQTRRHAELVKECIRILGAKPSKTKQAIGRVTGAVNSLSTEAFDDEVVRNFLADYATENLEIASFEAIIAAAEEAGHRKIAKLCGEILRDEEAMAAWLRDNLGRAVRDTLADIGVAR